MHDEFSIDSIEELTALYDAPRERAILKVLSLLDEHCRAFIAASPLLTLATCGTSSGVDCSPRGDQPGFVQVMDDKTLLIPDRRGNNRLDSLRNIVENPKVGLLFLVPGVHETFRINGEARLSTDTDLLARFVVNDKTPRTVIVVTVQEAFIHCSRALIRADFWNASRHIQRSELPSMGCILAKYTGGEVDAAAYDAQAAESVRKTLY